MREPRHTERAIIVAYIRDRAAQYSNSSGSRLAVEDIARAINDGEHVGAFTHGELDDLLGRPMR